MYYICHHKYSHICSSHWLSSLSVYLSVYLFLLGILIKSHLINLFCLRTWSRTKRFQWISLCLHFTSIMCCPDFISIDVWYHRTIVIAMHRPVYRSSQLYVYHYHTQQVPPPPPPPPLSSCCPAILPHTPLLTYTLHVLPHLLSSTAATTIFLAVVAVVAVAVFLVLPPPFH